MEKAADLLLTKEEKTYMIAEKVGYSDSNYFSYVFKLSSGCLRPNTGRGCWKSGRDTGR